MYVVVYGLGNAGLTDALAHVIQLTADKGLFAATISMGFIAAFLSSFMNNMPTVMIDALALAQTDTSGVPRAAPLYARELGSELGPKLPPLRRLRTFAAPHASSNKG